MCRLKLSFIGVTQHIEYLIKIGSGIVNDENKVQTQHFLF